MADLFAENGYTTVVVDLFNGDPVKLNRPPGFDFEKWLKHGSDGNNPHTPPYIDPIIEASIKYLKSIGTTKLAAVGYCFGAKVRDVQPSVPPPFPGQASTDHQKYVIRHYKNGIEVGFVAHPSFVEEDELAAIGGPLSIAAAETDNIFTTEKRHKSEEILKGTKKPFQINLFSGVEHGFAVRGNLEVGTQKFAKEQAFLQAVNWFDNYFGAE